MNSNGSYSPETPNSGPNWRLFVRCDLKIWHITLKNNRDYVKLKASFQNRHFVSRVTSKFDGWYWKAIGCLFYTTSSFVHHSKVINEFKLELQSGNAQFGSKSVIFCPVLPWNLMDNLKTIGHLFYATSSIVHHFIAIYEFKLELQRGHAQFGSKLTNFEPCDLESWRMTLKTIGHLS